MARGALFNAHLLIVGQASHSREKSCAPKPNKNRQKLSKEGWGTGHLLIDSDANETCKSLELKPMCTKNKNHKLQPLTRTNGCFGHCPTC